MEWTNSYYAGPACYHSPPPFYDQTCMSNDYNGGFYGYLGEPWGPEQGVGYMESYYWDRVTRLERALQITRPLILCEVKHFEDWGKMKCLLQCVVKALSTDPSEYAYKVIEEKLSLIESNMANLCSILP